MSSSENQHTAPVDPQGPSELPAGQSTQSSGCSTPERSITTLPCPSVPTELSAEPIPSDRPDLDWDNSTQPLTRLDIDTHPPRSGRATAEGSHRQASRERRQISDAQDQRDAESNEIPISSESDRNGEETLVDNYPEQTETEADDHRVGYNAASEHESSHLESNTGYTQHNPPPTPLLSNLSTPTLSSLSSNGPFSFEDLPENDPQQRHFYTEAEDTNANAIIPPSYERATADRYFPSSPILHAPRFHIIENPNLVSLPSPHAQAHTIYDISLTSLLAQESTTQADSDPSSSTNPLIPSAESAQADGLPLRPEPTAVTTMQRMQRGLRNVFRRETRVEPEATEMTDFQRISVSDPRLFRDGTRRAERERQRRDDGVQAPTPREQTNARVWVGAASILTAVTIVAVVYGVVNRYNGSK